MRCIGITKERKRCKNSCKLLFCKKHILQPVIVLFSLISFIGLIGGIYQDVWKEMIAVNKNIIEQGIYYEDTYLSDNNNAFGSWKLDATVNNGSLYKKYLSEWQKMIDMNETNQWLFFDLKELKDINKSKIWTLRWNIIHEPFINNKVTTSIEKLAYKNGYKLSSYEEYKKIYNGTEKNYTDNVDFSLMLNAFEYIGRTIKPPKLNLVLRNKNQKHITLLGVSYNVVFSISSGAGAGGEQIAPIDLNKTLIIDFYKKNIMNIHPPIIINPDDSTVIQFNIFCRNAGRWDGPGSMLIKLLLKYSDGKDIKYSNIGYFYLSDDIDNLVPEAWLGIN